MIDVVIVNWNAGVHLRDCVASVLTHDDGSIDRVTVIDNASTDGSPSSVRGLSGVNVTYTGRNLGFAAACNLGAATGASPYILFLNPDTRVEAGSLSAPLAFLERPENAAVGICGIQLVDERGKVSQTCARFPTLGRLTFAALGLDKLPGLGSAGMTMKNWDHTTPHQVDQIMGAFFLVRRDMFDSFNGFDERFFVYFEEVDLSFRLAQAGYTSWFLTEARAFHAGGGTSRQVKARRLFYSLRSRLLYSFKHFPRWKAWCLVGVTGVIEPVTRTVWCLVRADACGMRHTWSAYGMLWRGMGRIVRGEGRFEP